MPRRARWDPVVARQGELVAERDRDRPTGRLLRQDDMEASYVDLADPRHLEFDYMRWMRLVLRAAGARRVLHIGGAACALPRALADEDPGSRQEVCEVDPRVLEFARAHLGLRRMPGLRVRVAEGRAFLAAQPTGAWDAVVLDAYQGATIPDHLMTREALTEMARVAPLALVNVVDRQSGPVRGAVAAAVGGAFPRVWALGSRQGNVVIVGDGGGIDIARLQPAATADPSPARVMTPAETRQAIAGLAARTDAG
jgi:hypothetical protein